MTICGGHVHMCTKYEVFMFNPVPGGGGGCKHDTDADIKDDAQGMIVSGSLVDTPNELKTTAVPVITKY